MEELLKELSDINGRINEDSKRRDEILSALFVIVEENKKFQGNWYMDKYYSYIYVSGTNSKLFPNKLKCEYIDFKNFQYSRNIYKPENFEKYELVTESNLIQVLTLFRNALHRLPTLSDSGRNTYMKLPIEEQNGWRAF